MDQARALHDILETVVFIKDHAASKEDLAALEERMASKEDLAALEERMASKEDLAAMKDEIMTHLDGFVVLHKRIAEELVAVQANYDRLDGRVQQLAKHVNFRFQGV